MNVNNGKEEEREEQHEQQSLVHQKQHEQHINIVRRHFSNKGYRVHSGLQFGCELVLYADNPGRVHSDFCVHVLPPSRVYSSSSSSSTTAQKEEERNDALAAAVIDWRTIQTLVRSMPDLRKTLIIARVRRCHRHHHDISSGCIGGSGSVHDDIPTTAKVNSSSDSIKSSSISTTAIIKQNLQDEETIIDNGEDEGGGEEEEYYYIVDELAIATEHAPFRHKNIPLGVGTQVKPS